MYEYSEELNGFGIVKIDSSGKVSEQPQFAKFAAALSKFPTPSVLAGLVGFHSNRRNRCLHVYLSDPREQPPHAFVTRLRVDFRRAPRRSVWDYDVDFVTETLAYSVYVDELAAEAVDHQLDNTLLVHAREVDSRTDSPSLWDTQNETPDEESLLREYEAERRDDSDSTCSASTVDDLGYGDLYDLSLEPKCWEWGDAKVCVDFGVS